MTFNQKTSEAGWFYHAPAKPNKNDEAMMYPAMSQIPGLTEEDALPVENNVQRPLFRDTDSKYIRLAKQGGRQNLLVMKENSGEKKPPVNYPRNEWFYLHDNMLEQQAETQKTEQEYAFLRPDYMYHETHQPEQGQGQTYGRPGRGPLGFDRLSAFERDGHSANDKTVKLPELTKPGYGVRSSKPLRVPKTTGSKPPTATNQQRQRVVGFAAKEKADKATINKILSYAYDKDWQDQVMAYQNKSDTSRSKHHGGTMPQSMERIQTEYTSNYARRGITQNTQQQAQMKPESSSARSHESGPRVRQNEVQRLREAKLKKPQEKELFKLARFKNIPAKTESHRPIATQVA